MSKFLRRFSKQDQQNDERANGKKKKGSKPRESESLMFSSDEEMDTDDKHRKMKTMKSSDTTETLASQTSFRDRAKDRDNNYKADGEKRRPADSRTLDDVQKRLLDATNRDDADAVGFAIEAIQRQGYSMEDIDPVNERTIFHIALEERRMRVASYLVENCDPKFLSKHYTNLENQIPPSFKTSLHILAENGDVDLMERLLDRMPSLKKTQQSGPYMMPMFGGMQGLDDVREFVKETTVIKVDDNRRRRVAAIHLAAMNGHHGVFEVLCNKFGVNINEPDSDKETALMWAVKKGHLSTMKELIRQGADVNRQNKYDCSALHLAISGNQYDMVKALIISEDIDMNTERIKNPRWPIEMAANHNNLKMVKCLLKKNNKILPTNKHEALTIAAQRGYTEVVEAILDKEPELLNKPDDNGNTALMLAAESGMMETVKCLTQERKAKLTNRNNLRQSIFDIAMQQKSNELLEYLINLNTDGTCLWEINDSFYIHTAAANGDIQKIQFLMASEGAGVLLQQDENGNSFVHTAAANNRHQLLEHLLRDDDDFTELQNKMSETALHVAVKRGHLESVKVLLDKQARLDVADNNGQTPPCTPRSPRTRPV